MTFDPFCYLSLPLPIKKERYIDVVFVREDPLVLPMKVKSLFIRGFYFGYFVNNDENNNDSDSDNNSTNTTSNRCDAW